MSQAAYIQGMLAWDGPTNYVIIISSGAFLLKIRLCQVLALQLALRETGPVGVPTFSSRDGATIVYCLHSKSGIISNYLFKYF